MKRWTWSVETCPNDWNDDLFNGTLQQCVDYASQNCMDVEFRFAHICVDENNCVVDVSDILDGFEGVYEYTHKPYEYDHRC